MSQYPNLSYHRQRNPTEDSATSNSKYQEMQRKQSIIWIRVSFLVGSSRSPQQNRRKIVTRVWEAKQLFGNRYVGSVTRCVVIQILTKCSGRLSCKARRERRRPDSYGSRTRRTGTHRGGPNAGSRRLRCSWTAASMKAQRIKGLFNSLGFLGGTLGF